MQAESAPVSATAIPEDMPLEIPAGIPTEFKNPITVNRNCASCHGFAP